MVDSAMARCGTARGGGSVRLSLGLDLTSPRFQASNLSSFVKGFCLDMGALPSAVSAARQRARVRTRCMKEHSRAREFSELRCSFA